MRLAETQIKNDELLIWIYFCVTVCTLPGQYLFLASNAAVPAFNVMVSLGARVGQAITLAAILFLIGDRVHWYSEWRTAVCAASTAMLWALHLATNMMLLSLSMSLGMPFVGAGAVYCIIVLGLAFQISMPLVPGRVIPDMCAALSAVLAHLVGALFILGPDERQTFASALILLLLLAPILLKAEYQWWPCIEPSRRKLAEEDEPLVQRRSSPTCRRWFPRRQNVPACLTAACRAEETGSAAGHDSRMSKCFERQLISMTTE
jgi:hypothetical protein